MREATEPLHPRDHAAASDLLARAFDVNPPHRCIFADVSTRPARMQWLMSRVVRIQSDLCEGFGARRGGALACVGFWQPPSAREMGLVDMVRHGLIAAPFALGLRSTRRAVRIQFAMEHRRTEVLAGRAAWCLHTFGVDPSLQGQGVGTAVLRGELARLDARAEAHPIVLETQTEANVWFYRRLGFEVVDETPFEYGTCGFTSWIMMREPR